MMTVDKRPKPCVICGKPVLWSEIHIGFPEDGRAHIDCYYPRLEYLVKLGDELMTMTREDLSGENQEGDA